MSDDHGAEVSLLLVEDVAFWADYAAHVVRAMPGIRYLGCAGCLAEARRMLAATRPQLLLLDSRLPDGDGMVLAEEIRRTGRPVRIAAFTVRSDNFALHSFDRLQLDGLIWKNQLTEASLQAAVRDLCRGVRYLAPELADRRRAARANPDSWRKILSDREQSLLPRFGTGLSDAEIAEQTRANPATIRVHRQNIMRKLNLHRTIDLVRWALTEGFVPPP